MASSEGGKAMCFRTKLSVHCKVLVSLLHPTQWTAVDSRLRHACFACLQLALGTLVDPPVRSGVAHVAIPEDEGRV